MKKKQLFITIIIVFVIFISGFFIRLDYLRLPGIEESNREFYKDQNGLPYMYEFDSYYNYRLAKNFLDHGYLGDTIINGREWDIHSYYPPGVPMDYPPLLAYVTSFFYKLINLFTSVPLMAVCFWLPAFIGPLAGIVAYFFTRRFTNQYGAVAAGIFTVASPIYTMRTVAGFFDTDMFIIIFPLLISWFILESIQSKKRKMQIIYAAISALFMFIFSLAWSGWYYLFYIILIFFLVLFIWYGIKKRKSLNDTGYVAIIFTGGSLFLISILTGFSSIIKLISEPLALVKILGKNPWAPWPNVYSVVTELARPTVSEAIGEIGLILFLGVAGIILMLMVLLNNKSKKLLSDKVTWDFFSFLFIWLIVGSLSFATSNRFALLVIPPLIISTGMMIGILTKYLEPKEDIPDLKMLKKRKRLTGIISKAILFFILIPSFFGVHQIVLNMTPSANDALWNASEWIGNNTSPNTVIISNWSYGHLFTAIADRPIAFDGRIGYIENLAIRKNDTAFKYGVRSPSISREYWIDRALTADDETLSHSILSMLATTGDSAYLTLEDYTGSTAKSVEILNNILGLSRETALNTLKDDYNLNEKQSEIIISLSHPVIKTPFVLVSTDEMRDNADFIFKFGGWDLNNNKGTDYIYSIDNYDTEKNIIKSGNGIFMDMETGDIKWDEKTPYCVEIISENKIEKRYVDNKSDFCVIILMDDKKVAVIDKKFENSLFTKLFLEKSGYNYFKPIYNNDAVSIWE